jgi:hypothetical protein
MQDCVQGAAQFFGFFYAKFIPGLHRACPDGLGVIVFKKHSHGRQR